MTQPKPFRYWLKIFENRLEIWDSQAQEVYATFSRKLATILGAMTYMRELNIEDNLKQEQLQDELLALSNREGSDTSMKFQLEAAGYGPGGVL